MLLSLFFAIRCLLSPLYYFSFATNCHVKIGKMTWRQWINHDIPLIFTERRQSNLWWILCVIEPYVIYFLFQRYGIAYSDVSADVPVLPGELHQVPITNPTAAASHITNLIVNPIPNPITNPTANPITNPTANPITNPTANPIKNYIAGYLSRLDKAAADYTAYGPYYLAKDIYDFRTLYWFRTNDGLRNTLLWCDLHPFGPRNYPCVMERIIINAMERALQASKVAADAAAQQAADAATQRLRGG